MAIFCRFLAAKYEKQSAFRLKKSSQWPNNIAGDRFLTLAPTNLHRD
jgi:hypothetical protein